MQLSLSNRAVLSLHLRVIPQQKMAMSEGVFLLSLLPALSCAEKTVYGSVRGTGGPGICTAGLATASAAHSQLQTILSCGNISI